MSVYLPFAVPACGCRQHIITFVFQYAGYPGKDIVIIVYNQNSYVFVRFFHNWVETPVKVYSNICRDCPMNKEYSHVLQLRKAANDITQKVGMISE